MVKKNLILSILLLVASSASSGQIIPNPQSIERGEGYFAWNSPARVINNLKDKRFDSVIEYVHLLPDSLVTFSKRHNCPTIKLVQGKPNDFVNEEAYELYIKPDAVEIKAGSQAGLFYGIQTLLWLRDVSHGGMIRCATIKDSPVFGYRGFMLDVSRHFFTKEFIFKQIDLLSSIKVNVLHLHLVDTGGWRIEIKKYPQLTSGTAWRTHKDWREWNRAGGNFIPENEGGYGGYYTQDDIRDIIKYASLHQMEVIPEIDLPGHSSEVLAVMPFLRCDGPTSKWTSEMCLGNERTYRFCEDILNEIMDLFPSKYIHIGGDECNTSAWAGCSLCKELMKREGIKNPNHLQSYFTKRIEKYVSSRGKTIIGWDEMLDDCLAPNAVIMSWHEDPDGRDKIIKQGHPMIISSEGHFYLDYYQDYPIVEPICFGGYTPLRKTYQFDPYEDLSGNTDLVKGLQCNLWTEAVQTPEHAERMIYPRILAMAEISWSGAKQKDYDEFASRVKEYGNILVRLGYHPFDISGEFGPRPGSNIPVSSLSTGKDVSYLKPWSENFPAVRESSLTDGLLGDWGMNGMRWQGFDAVMDVTVDLKEVRDIHSVQTSFMQNSFTGMFLPEQFEIQISDNGNDFNTIYSLSFNARQNMEYCIEDFGWSGNNKCRFIRIIATHPSGWCWLMCDEIIVR